MDWWLLSNIVALVVSPFVAVQVSEKLQRGRERDRARLDIFRTLMLTRPAKLTPEHVRALNLIDIDFDGADRKSKAVRAAWKAYLDLLNSSGMNTDIWNTRRDDLVAMSAQVRHDALDKVEIKRSWYRPNAYLAQENQQNRTRAAALEVLERRSAIRVVALPRDELPPAVQAALPVPPSPPSATLPGQTGVQ